MPAFNAAPYIAEAIASVQAQTYAEWQLLVVDDGSTDGTFDVVRELASRDSRIKYWRKENEKQGKARNKALRHADGSLIAFLDADDWWLPNKLEVQTAEIEDTGADIIFSEAEVWHNGTNQGSLGSYRGWLQGSIGMHEMLLSNRIPVLTVMIRRRVLENAGFFSEDIDVQNAEDYHLWLRLLLLGYRFWGMNTVLACYRIHMANSTANPENSFWPACKAILQTSIQFPVYEAVLSEALRAKLIGWLDERSKVGTEKLASWFHIFYASYKQEVPMLLRIFLRLPFGPRISVIAFRFIYA